MDKRRDFVSETQTALFANTNETPSKQVAQAVKFANGAFSGNLGPKIVEASIDVSLEDSFIYRGLRSARSFVPTALMDQEERQAGERLGTETIGYLPWGYQIFVNPIDETKARKKIEDGIKNAEAQNLEGLKKIHQIAEEKYGINYDFESRNTDFREWFEITCRERDENGENFNDWGIIRKQGIGIVKRQDEPHFLVDTIRETDLTEARKLNDIPEKGALAKIILVTNAKGQVVGIETWFNHFNFDEDHGRRVAKNLIENFDIRSINEADMGPQILRMQEINNFLRPNFYIFDTEKSYVQFDEEKKLQKKARESLNDNLLSSELLALGFLAGQEGESAYICVRGKKGRLQLALLPKIEEINRIREIASKLRNNFNADNILRLIEDEGGGFWDIFKNTLSENDKFVKKEIENAIEFGANTISYLGSRVSDFYRNIFKIMYRRPNEIVSRGSSQVSKVNDLGEDIFFAKFITDLNLYANTALGVGKFKNGEVFSFRHRTNEADYKKLKKGLKTLGEPNAHNLKFLVERLVSQKVKDYRRSTAIFSFILASIGKEGEELEELKILANKVFEKLQ